MTRSPVRPRAAHALGAPVLGALVLAAIVACHDSPAGPVIRPAPPGSPLVAGGFDASARMVATSGPGAAAVASPDLELHFERPDDGDHAHWTVRGGVVQAFGGHGVMPTYQT